MDSCFKPSSRSQNAINNVLFPFQIYLFSQAEGDVTASRSETAIMQAYLSSLCSSCVRILTKALLFIKQTSRMADVISALRETALGHLLPYAVNVLYVGTFAMDVISYASGDLQELLTMWCQLMKLCRIDVSERKEFYCQSDLHQKNDSLMFLPMYDPNFTPTPQPISWYLTLFYLLTVVSSKIHYNTRYFQIADKTPELQYIAESYLFSGGLMRWRRESGLTSSEADRERGSFIQDVYENIENRYTVLHTYLDEKFPEPAWRRKHQPISVNLELRLLAVFAKMRRQSDDLRLLMDDLMQGKSPEVNENVSEIWKSVVSLRNFLREKKQEFVSHQNISASRTTNTITIVRRSSATTDSLRQQKMKEYTLRIRSSTTFQKEPTAGSSVINKGMRRLMTFEGESTVLQSSTEAQEFTEPEFVQPAESYEEFVDVMMEKMNLLMELEQPLDLNDREAMNISDNLLGKLEEPPASLRQHVPSKSQLGDDRSSTPSSIPDLVTQSIKKLLMLFIPASVNDIRRTLQARTENALTLLYAVEEVIAMLKTIENFPQAARLFLLGVSNALVNWKGGKAMEGYHRDYLHHTEGSSPKAYKALLQSWRKFGQYLIDLFNKCMINLNWRLGSAVLFVLVTMSSPKIPYFCLSLYFPMLIETGLHSLSNWYGRISGNGEEVLISPGPLWDQMAEKLVPLKSSYFQGILEEFKNRGNYLRIDQSVLGVFPTSLMMLANVLRVCYNLIVIDQVCDHRIKSMNSAAQNRESLFFWTLNDVSNLFIRRSTLYRQVTCVLLNDFVNFINGERALLSQLCQRWQPFAHSLYNQLNSSINPNACIRESLDGKTNLQGSVEMDCCVCAGEAFVACLMGLLVFVCKTEMRTVLNISTILTLGIDMMHLSPRIQRLMLMVLQNMSDQIIHVPSCNCFNHTYARSSSPENPLLIVPPDLSEVARCHLFMYHLLHLTSHADSCASALLGERAACALCCPYDVILFNLFSSFSPCASADRASLLRNLFSVPKQTICEMSIRPDGHSASYSAEITAEEAVYTLRRFLAQPSWKPILYTIFVEIAEGATELMKQEQSSSPSEELFLFLRTPWVTALIAVLKVLGGLSPHLYSGCRIRPHEFMSEGSSEAEDLLNTAYSSSGSGFVIKGNRTMSEVIVLMDKIDTPRPMSIYALDVIDREHVPSGLKDLYQSILPHLQAIESLLKLSNDLFAMPARSMPFFNTSALSLPVPQLQDAMIALHLVRCLQSILVDVPDLVQSLQQPVIAQILRIAVKPVACNMPLATSVVRQYYNWFVEYLINTYPGSPRFLPMELQSETSRMERERRRSYGATCGLGKDEATDPWDDGRPTVLRDEKRTKLAKTISGITGYSEDICYKMLRVSERRAMECSRSKTIWTRPCRI